MQHWSTLSFRQKSEIIGASLGAFFAALFGFGGAGPARVVALLIGAMVGWAIGRVVASLGAKK